MSDVPEGYKQTEVGVIPEDWEVKKLREISPAQSVGLVINPSTYVVENGSVPMLVGSDISPNKINWIDSRKITEASNKLLPGSQIFKDDLVMVRVGEPGVTAVIPTSISGCNCASMMIIRCDSSFSSDWLAYAMNSKAGLMQVENVQYGTAQKQFNISDAINFRYPCPPLPEQRAIASALADVDALITSLEALLTKKRQLKQAAMQELLTGRTRLEGFEGEWEEVRLGEIGQFLKGRGVRKDQAQSGRLPCIRYGELYTLHNNVVKHFASFISEEVSKEATPIRKGDILFAGSGETKEEIGKCAAFIDQFGAFAGGDIVIFRPAKSTSSIFLGYYCNSPLVSAQKASKGQGDAVVHISSNALANLNLSLPLFPEQQAIASILSDMDAEIDALEQRLGKTRALKQGMMQELLTGRTRLV